ncbi:hypothetical protein [Altererythrobacter sp.]|uniref:hypothetical protein n=1 Tax=Altererythrobacter sp. TaxID=1872480 RepID=UPI001B0CE3CE|nr:hypothetical protein [Altererythrobacter sp.]MBO6708187.1 hypothetical protein [Altererythrobacter sp.]MBO6945677.1 hypothetical protein [Altererythrobacter sp.]
MIKAEELVAVNYLAEDHPRPRSVEWINRGTDQVLRPTTTDMLLRTLFQPAASPSVQKLHESSGLRVIFRSDAERERFASAFREAVARERAATEHVVTAIFDGRDKAETAIAALRDEGIPPSAISLLCRASHFGDPEANWPDGHDTLSITGAVAGGGVAGALLGVAFLFVPGVGPLAAAGAIAGSAISSVASISGIIGATGGAVAKMLTDHDVDGVMAEYYDRQIKRGKVFVSVDEQETAVAREFIERILEQFGGARPQMLKLNAN